MLELPAHASCCPFLPHLDAIVKHLRLHADLYVFDIWIRCTDLDMRADGCVVSSSAGHRTTTSHRRLKQLPKANTNKHNTTTCCTLPSLQPPNLPRPAHLPAPIRTHHRTPHLSQPPNLTTTASSLTNKEKRSGGKTRKCRLGSTVADHPGVSHVRWAPVCPPGPSTATRFGRETNRPP